MKNRNLVVSLVSTLLVLASLSGCSPANTQNGASSSLSSNSSSSSSVDSPSNTDKTTTKLIDVCQLITASDIKELTGTAVTKKDDFLKNSTVPGCMYIADSGKSINMIVNIYPDAETAKKYYEEARTMLGEGSTTVTGVGKDAFLNVSMIVTQLITYDGTKYFTLTTTMGEKSTQEKQLKTLAEMLYKKLQ